MNGSAVHRAAAVFTAAGCIWCGGCAAVGAGDCRFGRGGLLDLLPHILADLRQCLTDLLAELFAVPFLYVSRFQFLFEIGVAAVIYILVNKNMRKSTLVLLGFVVCAAYVVITLSQKRDAIYLNNVFKMKYTHMPVFLTQPYIYIANNYDNFDCLVKNLPKFSCGLRMLFPFVSLTGLKFVMPNLVPATVYLTSTELTTFTMFYDAYYDFGVIGVFVIALLIGVVAKVIIDIIKKSDNPVVYLFYGQIAVYLALAFFTTWFSSPATWFWLIITGMIYCYVGYDKK